MPPSPCLNSSPLDPVSDNFLTLFSSFFLEYRPHCSLVLWNECLCPPGPDAMNESCETNRVSCCDVCFSGCPIVDLLRIGSNMLCSDKREGCEMRYDPFWASFTCGAEDLLQLQRRPRVASLTSSDINHSGQNGLVSKRPLVQYLELCPLSCFVFVFSYQPRTTNVANLRLG